MKEVRGARDQGEERGGGKEVEDKGRAKDAPLPRWEERDLRRRCVSGRLGFSDNKDLKKGF